MKPHRQIGPGDRVRSYRDYGEVLRAAGLSE
jgi:hypothetical protein